MQLQCTNDRAYKSQHDSLCTSFPLIYTACGFCCAEVPVPLIRDAQLIFGQYRDPF